MRRSRETAEKDAAEAAEVVKKSGLMRRGMKGVFKTGLYGGMAYGAFGVYEWNKGRHRSSATTGLQPRSSGGYSSQY